MPGTGAGPGGVQSVVRAFRILDVLAEADGELSISELAVAVDLPQPTIHRIVATLRELGHAHQVTNRRYTLGPRLIGLGDRASRVLGVRAGDDLRAVAERFGETANMAVLDGERAVYTAQVPGPHSMRTFTEVGRRVSPHCTAVGKALLSRMPVERAREVLRHTDFVRHTDNTITSPEEYFAELDKVRAAGYAVDEGEQELGVRCVAVALDGPLPAAVSISGPTTRMTDALLDSAVPKLRSVADALVAELARQDAAGV